MKLREVMFLHLSVSYSVRQGGSAQPGYGQQAGITHSIGMHPGFDCDHIETANSIKFQCKEINYVPKLFHSNIKKKLKDEFIWVVLNIFANEIK